MLTNLVLVNNNVNFEPLSMQKAHFAYLKVR